MRHEKAFQLLDLALRLSASAEGLTLDEMAEAVCVGRRTAERMRDALEQLFPQMEQVREGTTKRFRLPGGVGTLFQAPTVEELPELAQACQALSARGFSTRAKALATLERKLRSTMKSAALRRLAPDVEALARAEFQGARIGPRPHDDPHALMLIRRAIIGMETLRFRYHGGSNPGAVRSVRPLGLLLDRNTYLVACLQDSDEPRNWRLDRISDIEATGEIEPPPIGFDLETYANRSFGIYQDAVEEVRLQILPHGAEEVKGWLFHPTQELSPTSDGGYLVSFRSGGMRELAWHLFTWGDKVRILAPEALKAEMAAAIKAATSQLHPISR